LQALGVPAQTPPVQVSLVVQASPSLQLMPSVHIAVCWQPLPTRL
jgi:hypothetical protein